MISDIVRALVAAKATPEMILAAVEAAEAAEATALEKRRASDRERQNRRRGKAASHVTSRDVTVTPRDTVPPKESFPHTPFKETTPSDLVSEATPPSTKMVGRSVEERFWDVYPKREGPNPKKPALEKLAILLRSGVDPDEVLAGTVAYAAECKRLEKSGTSLVMQATRFLNQRVFSDYAKQTGPPASELTPAERSALNREIAARLQAESQANGRKEPIPAVLREGGGAYRGDGGQRPENVPDDQAGTARLAGVGDLFPGRLRVVAGGYGAG